MLAGVCLVLAVLAAYHNSFSGPFVFDDPPSIADNPTIRSLWPLSAVLSPPAGAGVGGRPVANLTLALNYAAGGNNVLGYHIGNLGIHTLAALALFGLVRRTLLQPVLRERFGAAATWLALGAATLWAIHPVQTISVNYLSQRTESLMGLFYLVTLYCFARGTAQDASRGWRPLALAACALGMASKEVMVTAPLMVLLYDRTFVAGSFSAAWRLRWRFYLGLAATWLLLAYLMIGLETRGVGFGFKLKWWTYLGAGCYAMFTYFRIALWPQPLVFDYGPNVAESITVAPYAVVVFGLLVLTGFALWRWPFPGFFGAWFFVILAPTSSIVPIVRQMVAENRVYLPIAAVTTLVVLGTFAKFGRRILIPMVALAVGFGCLTSRRNETYRSEVALWTDTVNKRPDNWRAHNSLALALGATGRAEESIAHFETSLRIEPTLAETHNNLGTQLEQIGRLTEAIVHYEEALHIESWRADTHTNLGNVLCKLGRVSEAIGHFETAIRLAPALAEAHTSLGNAMFQAGRIDEAVRRYHEALHLDPRSPDAHNNLGQALTQLGRAVEAMPHFEKSLQFRPNSAATHYNFANALVGAGRTPEAEPHYEAALRLDPTNAESANNLAVILLQSGRREQARHYFEAAVRVNPAYVEAGNNLAIVLTELGFRKEARQRLEAVLRTNPSYADAHYNLAMILADDGLPSDARVHFEAALRIKPDYAQARIGLDRLLASPPTARGGEK